MNLSFPRFGLSCLVAIAPVCGQEFRSYVGETNAVWESPTNWNPNLVPDSITEGARLDNGATVNVGGSHSIAALEMKAGSLILNQVNTLRTGTLLIESAGVIGGPGTLVLTNSGTINDNSGVSFSNVTFRNEGVLNLFLGIGLAGGTVFQNVNTTNFVDGSIISTSTGAGAPGYIENTGFLRKTSGAGSATIGVPITNSNEILSQSGILNLTAEVNSSGRYRTEAGGTILLTNTNILSNGAAISGQGETLMTSGSVTVPAGATVSAENFTVSGGQILGEGTINYLGANNIWASGTMAGSINSRINSGAVLTVARVGNGVGFTGTHGVEVMSGGTLLFGFDNSVLTSNGKPVVVNHGTVDFAGDGDIRQNGPFDPQLMVFRNEAGGRVVKSAGNGELTEFVAEIVSEGDWEVEEGVMRFFRKVDFSGPMEAAPGAEVSLRGGAASPSILRSGARFFGGGDFEIKTNVEIPAGNLAEIDRMRMVSGGALGGAGTVRISGESEWTLGNLKDGVVLEIAPSSRLLLQGNGSGTFASSSTPTILNRGIFEFADTSSLNSNGAGQIDNIGTLKFSKSSGLRLNSGVRTLLNNTGSLVKEDGGEVGSNARSTLTVDLTHSGMIEVESGTLELVGNHQISGPITVENGAIIEFDGVNTTNFKAGSSIEGGGIVEHRGSEFVIPAGVRIPFQNYTTPSGSGKVSGGGTFAIADDSTFTRVNHLGPGVTEIATGAVVEITPSSFRLSEERELHVQGSLTFGNSFNFTASNGVTLDNDGLIVFQGGSSWNHGGGEFVIENSGTIQIEAPSNQTVSFAPDEVSGNGLFDVRSGTLRFSRAVDVMGRVQLASGAKLSGVGLSLGSGSIVSGVGQVSGPVTFKGAVSPGLSIGTLNVSSSASFASTGSLVVELGNGTSDQLVVSSAMDLGGLTIMPTPIDGFTPSAGDSWVIATASSFSGEVGLVAQASAAPGFGYFVSQDGNNLTLSYSVVDSFQKAIEAATGLSLGADPDLSAFAVGDVDGDGVQDLTDWAFGGTLGGPDPGRGLRVDSVIETSPTTREVTLAFPIRSLVSDVTMSLESNLDLEDAFSPVAFTSGGTEIRGGILFQIAVVEVPVTDSQNFFRVKVELN